MQGPKHYSHLGTAVAIFDLAEQIFLQSRLPDPFLWRDSGDGYR